ncbi:MAG: PDZ domain-containing protein [Elusimicrobiota bacterium]|nr:PDZ domain-containing protein [Elusimicrobiota bacterium]
MALTTKKRLLIAYCLLLIACRLSAQQNYILQLKFDIVESNKKPTKQEILENVDNLLRRTKTEKCKYIIGGNFALQEFVNNEFAIKTESSELKLQAGYLPVTDNKFKIYYKATVSYPMQDDSLSFLNDVIMNYNEIKILAETKLPDGIRDTRPYWVVLRTNKQEVKYVEENIGNIGVTLSMRDGYPYVLMVVKDSPAENSSIKQNDMIVEVDDINMYGKNLQDVLNRIRGKPNTFVKLKIKSDSAFREVIVERKILKIP